MRMSGMAIVLAGMMGMGLSSVQAAPEVVKGRIAQSLGSRTVMLLTVGDTEPDALGRGIDQRPGLVIIAGAQGNHTIGTDVANQLAQRLIDEHADLLSRYTVYIVPSLNPDGAARYAYGASGKGYHAETGRAPDLSDADRDGRLHDDGPDDLNNDGYITLMRVPAPNWKYGIEATHVIDTDDPRLMHAPKADSEEIATHALLIEGIDNDNDGKFNEDGWGGAAGGGIDFDLHFPIHWPEHKDGAGLYPLERPETRGLVEWVLGRPNIVAAIVYGPHDTITSVPATGQYGPERRVPKGIEAGDKAAYEMIAKAYRGITGITKVENAPDRDGSLVQWLYAELGLYSFGTPIWVRPDLVKKESAEAATIDASPSSESAPAEADPPMPSTEPPGGPSAPPGGGQGRPGRGGPGGGSPGRPDGGRPGSRSNQASARHDSTDALWMKWIDEHNGGHGFVNWQPFDHPQLGAVEIGGFVPGVRVNPPAALVGQLVDEQLAFAVSVLEHFPVVEFDEPSVERVGPGLYRISVTATNTGKLPKASAMAVKTRRLAPLVLALDPEQALDTKRILSGSRVQRINDIAPNGQSEHAWWLIAAEDGTRVTLEIRSSRFGSQRKQITLEEGR